MEITMPHLNHRRGETRRSVNREVRCSCSMCGNPRRHAWFEPRTRAELKAELAQREAEAELHGASIDRPRPRKRKPRPWAIQKIDFRPSGEPYDMEWWTCRRYRTEKAAQQALGRLQRSPRRWRRTGQVRSVYRIVGPGGCVLVENE